MATARHRHDRADGPTGWMILLGLMVLALVIAWSAKGCDSSNDNQGALPGTNTGTSTSTTGTSTSANAGQSTVDEIKALVLRNGGIQFKAGSGDLTTASQGTLDSVAQILTENPTVNIVITGHTDTLGDAADNKVLSQKRANAVRDYLLLKGVALARLTARGLGEEQPLVANDANSEAAQQQNRRVEFSLGN